MANCMLILEPGSVAKDMLPASILGGHDRTLHCHFIGAGSGYGGNWRQHGGRERRMAADGGKNTARLAIAQTLFLAGRMTDHVVSNQGHLPDPTICRTRHLGKGLDLSKCLVEDSDGCQFAVRFSSGVICRHPERRNFETTTPP
jgi:hypothetical protein